jgi:hypothetical protein
MLSAFHMSVFERLANSERWKMTQLQLTESPSRHEHFPVLFRKPENRGGGRSLTMDDAKVAN